MTEDHFIPFVNVLADDAFRICRIHRFGICELQPVFLQCFQSIQRGSIPGIVIDLGRTQHCKGVAFFSKSRNDNDRHQDNQNEQ